MPAPRRRLLLPPADRPRPAPASPALAAAPPQKEGSDKPVSDQWLDPFVIVGEDSSPVGTVQDGEPRGRAVLLALLLHVRGRGLQPRGRRARGR